MLNEPAARRARLVSAPEEILAQRDFPAWHFAMLNDKRRNAAIESAIAALDLRGKTVFEIGAGTGIIALVFAKHGAEHVFTCEMNPTLARIAGDIVAASLYRSRITVLHATSRQVVRSGLLPRAPDVIFTETVDCGIVGEGFFEIREDIQEVAGPDTVVLPSHIEQHGAIIQSATMRGMNEVETVCGFDLSALNRFSTSRYFPVRAPLYPFTRLSDAAVVRTYDYRGDDDNLYSLLRIQRPGIAHGLLSWFKLQFGAYSVSNLINLDSHWHQAFHPFAKPREVAVGDSFHLQVDDTGAARIKEL